MLLAIFSIYDQKADAYAQPFFCANANVAQRSVMQAMHPDSQLYVHATDFVLFKIGEYDDSTGKITPTEFPENIATMQAIKAQMTDEMLSMFKREAEENSNQFVPELVKEDNQESNQCAQ